MRDEKKINQETKMLFFLSMNHLWLPKLGLIT